MTHFTFTNLLTGFASLATTLFIMYFFAQIIQTRISNLNALFICVLSTSLIMAASISFTPDIGLQQEHAQFLIAVAISTLVYSAFLSASILKSVFLAATNFLVQVITLLGFSFAVSFAHAQQLL